MDSKYNKSVESLIPKHGGYRKLKSFQLAQLVYDVTMRFCDLYISKKSRTHDQMVQAARSGVQNIAEGSQAGGTSKKTELKLTNVARASLEELKLDYEDFLRQRNLPLWNVDDPRRKDLVNERCKTAEEVALWVRKVHDGCGKEDGRGKEDGQNGRYGHDGQYGRQSATGESIESTKSVAAPETYSTIAANAALVLTGVACALLDRQIKSLADTFEKEGGFTEKLYRTRQNIRNQK